MGHKKIRAIVAVSSNWVIGKDNMLPWYLPEDLKFFKQQTKDCYLVVGSKTFQSLPKIKNRSILILSKTYPVYHYTKNRRGVLGRHIDFNELSKLDKPVWLGGGAQIYKSFLRECSEVYLTWIYKKYEGNAFFPKEELDNFKEYNIIQKNQDFEIRKYTK